MQNVAVWVAAPELRDPVPREADVVVSVKVTVPVAVEGATAAVRLMLSPVVSVPVVVEVSVVVVVVRFDPADTVTETAAEVLDSYVLSPLYFAVSESVPAAVKV